MRLGDLARGPKCWAREHLEVSTPCDGALIRAHLIPKQRIKAQFPRGAELTWHETPAGHAVWRPVPKSGPETPAITLAVELMWDRRVWVPMCGGPTGIGGHHGALDYTRSLRIPRAKLPPELEEFAAEYGLEWSLEADYGPKEV